MWYRVAGTVAISLALLTGCSASGTLPPSSAGAPMAFGSQTQKRQLEAIRLGAGLHHVCARIPGHFHCDAIVTNAIPIRFDATPNTSCLHRPGCYGPSDLRAAYGLTQASVTGGKGMTIAIVDAYGYPGLAHDLAAYRSFFGLPPCGGACFKVLNQQGRPSPLPPPNPGNDWRPEIALDVDMVSAICPNCHIVLFEANSDLSSDFYRAEALAKQVGNVVSDSWGGTEFAASDALFDVHPGKVIVTSSGDNGAGVQQPCSFSGIVCVGGTDLVLANGRRVSEVVWDGLVANQCSNGPCATGSGCSQFVPKPSWQTDKGCAMRSETDVSADADPATGVVFSCSPCGTGGPLFGGEGGTSAAAPMIASMFALAGSLNGAGPAKLWSKGGTSAFHDILHGTNENNAAGTFICPPAYSYICIARKGYDGPTGWGTPNGLAAF